MKKQEVLERAVRKAMANGYVHGIEILKPNSLTKLERRECDFVSASDKSVYWKPHGQKNTYRQEVNYLLFNHDFAKALWGEAEWYEPQPPETFSRQKSLGWQYHLQQMVIADDPIKYLEENV